MRLKPAYERLRQRLQSEHDLPTWERMRALARSPNQRGLKLLKQEPWSAWLHRVLASLISTERPDSKPRMMITSWLAECYNWRLPAELSLEWREPVDEDRSEPMAAGDGTWRLVLVSVSIGLATLVLLYLGFSWLLDKLFPEVLGTGSKIGIYIGIFVLLSLIQPVRQWILSLMAAAGRVELMVAPARVKSSMSAPYSMRLHHTRRAFNLRRFFHFVEEPIVEVIGETPEAGPYSAMAEELPDNMVQELTSLREALGNRWLPVRLAVDQSLAAVPWEALLYLTGADPRSRVWREPFCIWRHVPRPTPADALDAETWSAGEIRVVAGPTWAGRLEQGWSSLGAKITVSDDLLAFKTGGPYKVLHLIGDIQETNVGLMFEIGRLDSAELEISTQMSQLDRRPGIMLSSQELPAGNRTGLIVIQSTMAAPSVRQEIDRRSAARFKAFAAELARSGAPAVLVLPPLSPQTTTYVLSEFCKRLDAQRPPAVKDFVQAVSRVRKAVAYSSTDRSADYDSMRELALDVCLYLAGPETSGFENVYVIKS
jgi:hypothetical protein